MTKPTIENTEEGPEPLVYPLWPDTGRRLGLCRNATYDAANRGQIPTVPFGRLKKVPAWFYRKLLDGAAGQ